MQAKLLPFALKCAKSTKNFRKYLKFIFYVSTSRLDHQDVCKIVETLNKYLLLSSAKCPFQTVKYYFCAGNFSVVNGSCAEMKAEHLRKFRKFGVSRSSEMAFSEFSLPLFARPDT
jgi:hypothetical protein